MTDEPKSQNESEDVQTAPEEGAAQTQPDTESAGNEGEGNDTDGATETATEGADTSEEAGGSDENPDTEKSEGSEADATDGATEEETEDSSEPTDDERKDYEFLKEQMGVRTLDPDETARFDKLLPKFEKVADSSSY